MQPLADALASLCDCTSSMVEGCRDVADEPAAVAPHLASRVTNVGISIALAAVNVPVVLDHAALPAAVSATSSSTPSTVPGAAVAAGTPTAPSPLLSRALTRCANLMLKLPLFVPVAGMAGLVEVLQRDDASGAPVWRTLVNSCTINGPVPSRTASSSTSASAAAAAAGRSPALASVVGPTEPPLSHLVILLRNLLFLSQARPSDSSPAADDHVRVVLDAVLNVIVKVNALDAASFPALSLAAAGGAGGDAASASRSGDADLGDDDEDDDNYDYSSARRRRGKAVSAASARVTTTVLLALQEVTRSHVVLRALRSIVSSLDYSAVTAVSHVAFVITTLTRWLKTAAKSSAVAEAILADLSMDVMKCVMRHGLCAHVWTALTRDATFFDRFLRAGSDALYTRLDEAEMLTFFCASFSQVLVMCDDIDFYEKQVVMPLEQIADVARFLSSLLFRLMWVEYTDGSSFRSARQANVSIARVVVP